MVASARSFSIVVPTDRVRSWMSAWVFLLLGGMDSIVFGPIRWCVWSFRLSSPLRLPHLKFLFVCFDQLTRTQAELPSMNMSVLTSPPFTEESRVNPVKHAEHEMPKPKLMPVCKSHQLQVELLQLASRSIHTNTWTCPRKSALPNPCAARKVQCCKSIAKTRTNQQLHNCIAYCSNYYQMQYQTNNGLLSHTQLYHLLLINHTHHNLCI